MPPASKTPANTGRLTDVTLRAAKPVEKPYKIAAGGGLYLEVMPSGSKLWRWKYMLAGKENRYAIGAYPAVLLTNARAMQEEARKLVKAGTHPSHQKQLKRITQATEHANTFKAVALSGLPPMLKPGRTKPGCSVNALWKPMYIPTSEACQ